MYFDKSEVERIIERCTRIQKRGTMHVVSVFNREMGTWQQVDRFVDFSEAEALAAYYESEATQ